MRESLWKPFLEKDYHAAAVEAARIIQEADALEAIHVAGLALIGLDRLTEGIDWICASLALADAKEEWYANAAISLMDKEQYAVASNYLHHGIEKFPSTSRLQYIRGLVNIHQHNWNAAIEHFNKTLELAPEFYHAKLSKGYAYHMLGQYDLSLETYASMENVSPEDTEEMVNNTACVYLEQGKQKEALALLEEKYPNSQRAGTQYNKSFLHLGLGHWPLGWELYEYRDTAEVHTNNKHSGIPKVPFPAAKCLDDIRDKKLFLFHEQGLGDSIQFMRYAKLVRPLVKTLVVGVPPSLHRLMEHLTVDDFTVESSSKIEVDCDVAVSSMSCPMLFKQEIHNIPADVPYYTIPQNIITKRQLEGSTNPRIGLVWAGASRPDNIRAHSINRRRSIDFGVVRPLLDRFFSQVDFVSLQRSDHKVDYDMYQPIQDDFDFLDTAAYIMQLDLVITIDSSIAHLAGALNKPVWMLSRLDACWRWGWALDPNHPMYSKTPWYPSMTIIRQKEHGTWPEVMERLTLKLEHWLEGK